MERSEGERTWRTTPDEVTVPFVSTVSPPLALERSVVGTDHRPDRDGPMLTERALSYRTTESESDDLWMRRPCYWSFFQCYFISILR
jgi:hypothetical protein